MKYSEDYIGKEKFEDVDWRKLIDKSDPVDDEDDDKPASKELIELIGVDPDALDYESVD